MKATKGIYIIGTDTDVGKTVVSAGLMHIVLSKGYNACYFKPISSGGTETGKASFIEMKEATAKGIDAKGFCSYDVSFVKSVSGFVESDDTINPFRYKTAVSPHLASEIEGFSVDKSIILDRYSQLAEKYEYVLVEGCGGIAVPLSKEGYMQYQLIKELGVGCILVSRTTIGTINHTLLTLSFAQSNGIPIHGIIFNGFCGSLVEQDNIDSIRKMSSVPVIGIIPFIEGVDVENQTYGELRSVFDRKIHIDEMMKHVRF